MNPVEGIMQLGLWGQQHQSLVLGGLGGVAALGVGSGLVRKWRHGDPTTHGSARWSTYAEVRQAGMVGRHGVVMGRLKGRLLFDDFDTHILLIGPTRGGKGVGVIIPTLLTWRESAIILDPKDGENADVTMAWRHRAKNQIALFTPCRSPHTCLNILDTIRLKTRQEFGDAYVIAQSLTSPEKLKSESATSLHFRELAALLLSASILHVCYTATRKSLAGVWQFLTQAGDLATTLKTMATTAHSSHGVHQAIAQMTTAIRNIAGDRELSSVWSTTIRPLVLYSDPIVAASTDRSTLDLETLQYGPQPVSLYLCAPSPMALERLHPLYRVILDVGMTRLMEHKVRTWTHRLLLVGDELPWYGYTRTIDKGIAVMAGYGIKSLLVTQDLPALEQTYGEQNALWGNTATKIFHAPENDLTAKRISENFMGRGTMAHPVESRQAGLFAQRSVSQQHVARALLTTDEVMELESHLEIIRRSGIKPILATKVNYRVDRDFKGRWTA